MVFDAKISSDFSKLRSEGGFVVGLIQNPFVSDADIKSNPRKFAIRTSVLDQMKVRSNYVETFLKECERFSDPLQKAYLAMCCLNWVIFKGFSNLSLDIDERCIFFSTAARDFIFSACDFLIWDQFYPGEWYFAEKNQDDSALLYAKDETMDLLHDRIIRPLYLRGTYRENESVSSLDILESWKNYSDEDY